MKNSLTGFSFLVWVFVASGCRLELVDLRSSGLVAVPQPNVTPAPTAAPRPSVSPAPTSTPIGSSGLPPLPSGATLVKQFDFAASAGPMEAYASEWAPHPWIQNPCGRGSLRVSADKKQLHTTLRDGHRFAFANWNTQYCRADIALAGAPTILENVKTVIEWQGYFPQEIYVYDGVGATVFNAIFEIHNYNDYSPMWAFAIDVVRRKVMLARHTTAVKPRPHVDIADFSTFLNRPRNLKMVIFTHATQGSFEVYLDGKLVHSEYGVPTSNTPGRDYTMFGLYDWGKAQVRPDRPDRGRVFDMVTQMFRVYRMP